MNAFYHSVRMKIIIAGNLLLKSYEKVMNGMFHVPTLNLM